MLIDELKSQFKIRQDLIKVKLNNNIKSVSIARWSECVTYNSTLKVIYLISL
jgi:hypothetical protein